MTESRTLINDDLAPVPAARRTWSMWSIAALWIGMAICITTYTLASSLIEQGMNWRQAVLTIFLGNLIVLIPMTLNAHPGTAYGIPFPVLIRASFGTLGSNIPALMRAKGVNVVLVDVAHRPRTLGTSKYGVWNRVWVGIADMFGVRWIVGRLKPPVGVHE